MTGRGGEGGDASYKAHTVVAIGSAAAAQHVLISCGPARAPCSANSARSRRCLHNASSESSFLGTCHISSCREQGQDTSSTSKRRARRQNKPRMQATMRQQLTLLLLACMGKLVRNGSQKWFSKWFTKWFSKWFTK